MFPPHFSHRQTFKLIGSKMRFLVVLVFSVTLIVYSGKLLIVRGKQEWNKIVIYTESLNCDKPDEGINTEVKLKKKLFCNNYDKEIRPGPSNEVTKLNFRYTIKSFDYVSVFRWNEVEFREL